MWGVANKGLSRGKIITLLHAVHVAWQGDHHPLFLPRAQFHCSRTCPTIRNRHSRHTLEIHFHQTLRNPRKPGSHNHPSQVFRCFLAVLCFVLSQTMRRGEKLPVRGTLMKTAVVWDTWDNLAFEYWVVSRNNSVSSSELHPWSQWSHYFKNVVTWNLWPFPPTCFNSCIISIFHWIESPTVETGTHRVNTVLPSGEEITFVRAPTSPPPPSTILYPPSQFRLMDMQTEPICRRIHWLGSIAQARIQAMVNFSKRKKHTFNLKFIIALARRQRISGKSKRI